MCLSKLSWICFGRPTNHCSLVWLLLWPWSCSRSSSALFISWLSNQEWRTQARPLQRPRPLRPRQPRLLICCISPLEPLPICDLHFISLFIYIDELFDSSWPVEQQNGFTIKVTWWGKLKMKTKNWLKFKTSTWVSCFGGKTYIYLSSASWDP